MEAESQERAQSEAETVEALNAQIQVRARLRAALCLLTAVAWQARSSWGALGGALS